MGGELQRLEREAVDGAQVAAAELEDALVGVGVEGVGVGTGEGAALQHVGVGLLAREKPQRGVMSQPLGHRRLLGTSQEALQRRLAREYQRHHEAAVHLEVGQQPQHRKRFGAQLVRLVQHDHRAQPLAAAGVLESVLQLAHERRVNAGG